MESNLEKCNILNVGKYNPFCNYYLNSTPISRSRWERDFKVLLNFNLHPKNQCIQSKNWVNKVLSFIARGINNKSAEVILMLCLAFIKIDHAI